MASNKDKTESDIEFEAQRIHQMLFGEKKPTSKQLNSMYEGFSEQDKSRVETRLMEKFYSDLTGVERILNNSQNPDVAEIFRTALKAAVRHFEGGHPKAEVDNSPIDGSEQANRIYELMANSNGNWENNKSEIREIFENLSNRDRAQVNELVYSLVQRTPPKDIVRDRYQKDVTQLAIQANQQALHKMLGQANDRPMAQQSTQENPIERRSFAAKPR